MVTAGLALLLVACSAELEPISEQGNQEVRQRDAMEPAPQTHHSESGEAAARRDELTSATARPVDREASSQSERVESETRQSPSDGGVAQPPRTSDDPPVPEAPALESGQVAAVISRETDVYLRPALGWPVVDQLEVGEAVVAQNGVLPWVRIQYREGRLGWVHQHVLEFSDDYMFPLLEIRDQAAPTLFANWHGRRFDVLGRSADGRYAVLTGPALEQDDLTLARIDEVVLLDVGFSARQLPLVIGSETVAFPADRVTAGHGRTLPQANQWMWLPWGWLLAHNDDHIWLWRPETDTVEFTPRAPGPAMLSPDGQFIAIFRCNEAPIGCLRAQDVTILPLDGSTSLSVAGMLRRTGRELEFAAVTSWFDRSADQSFPLMPLQWTADSQAVLVSVDLGYHLPHAMLATVDGAVTLFDPRSLNRLPNQDCAFLDDRSRRRPTEHTKVHWHPRHDGTVGLSGWCRGDGDVIAVFDVNGELQHVEPADYFGWTVRGTERLRSAEGAEQFGDSVDAHWSPSGRFAVVDSDSTTTLWLYDSIVHRLSPVELGEYVRAWHNSGGLGRYQVDVS